jgi:energy-coupling factor transport system permease protein
MLHTASRFFMALMDSTSFGLFMGGNGWLHRLHPLTKMAAVGACILLAFAPVWLWNGIARLPIALILGLMLVAFSNGRTTGWTVLKRVFFIILPLAISLFFVQGFFNPSGQTVLFQIGVFSLKLEGLYFGASVLVRLMVVTFATMVFITTTHPADLTLALTQIGVPREIAYVILSALQLIPRMSARADAIMNAQQARGLATEGNLLVRIRALFPLLSPLIISALQETEERALALEVRAFRSPGAKTAWRELHDSPPQRIARWLMLVGALALLSFSLFNHYITPFLNACLVT